MRRAALALLGVFVPSGVRSALRISRIRWFLAGLATDQFADTFWLVTLGWVAGQNASPALYGAIMTVGTLPAMGLFLPGGSTSDRVGAGTVLLATSLARAGLAAVWLLFSMHSWSSGAIVVAVTIVAILYDTSIGYHAPARESYVTVLTSTEQQVADANDAERLIARLGQTLGAVSAGFFVGSHLGGAFVFFAITVVTWLIFVRVRRIAQREPQVAIPVSSASANYGGMKEGINLLRAEPVLLRTYPLQSLTSMAGGGTVTVGGVLLVHEHGWAGATYGLAMGLFVLGIFIGTRTGIAIRENAVARPVSIAVSGSLLAAIVEVAAALTPNSTVYLIGCLLIGLLTGPMGPILTGYAKVRAKSLEHEHGKVVAGRLLAPLNLGLSLEPVGYLVVAVSAATVSPGLGIVVLAALTIVVAIAALVSRAVQAARLPSNLS